MPNSMILPDYPIEDEGADKLHRAPLAKKVAELIASFKGKESFVIGIEGVWGSGKTSFINLMRQELKGKNDLIFVFFNPWNFSDQNGLISDFFASIATALKKDGGHDALVRKLASYASRFQVTVNPSISIFGTSISLGQISTTAMTLQEKRDEIDAYLRGTNEGVFVRMDENDRPLPAFDKKIVIVIDDTDRLDADETRLVMKLVKMTANFPNTIFLIAYDRKRVAEKLERTEWSGEEYLKKIVQVSFTLPPADPEGLRRILFADLDETVQGVYGEVKIEGQNEKRWNDLGFAGFAKLFRTIRDIKRYISSLRLDWSIVGTDNVNLVDFMAVEAIRVVAPNFYSAIAANEELFTGERFSLVDRLAREEGTAQLAQFQELLGLVPKDARSIIEKICHILFPNLAKNSGYQGGDWQQIWRREKRVCATERFRFYFQLGVPEGGISETEVNALMIIIKDKAALTERFLELSKDERLRAMLNKLMDRVKDFEEETAKVLIATLWNLEKEITSEREAILDFDDIKMLTSRMAYHSIKNGVVPARRLLVLKQLVSEARNLYSPNYFVAILGDQHTKESSTGEPPLVTKAEADELQALALTRIQKAAADGTLDTETELLFELFRWKAWEGEAAVQTYIKKLISTRTGLLAFLRSFLGKVFSSTGNYDKLNNDGIAELYPLAEIEKQVAAITDKELEAMDERSREAIKQFRNPRPRW